MHRPPRRKGSRSRTKNPLPPPAPWTQGERLQLAAGVLAVAAILLAITWYHVVKIERYGLDANVQYVAGEYHLDADQAQRLRTLEAEYHGRNKHLGFLTPGDGASEEHHRAVSRCMDPEQARRFLVAEAGRVR